MAAGLPVSIAVLWEAVRSEAGITLDSADFTYEKLATFLADVRSRGAAAAQQQYATLQNEYAAAYAQYQQAQLEIKPREEATEKLLGQVDDQLRRVIEQAAKFKLQGRQQMYMHASQEEEQTAAFSEHPKYTAIVSGLSETHRSWVDKIVYPYYVLKWELEEAENGLWVKHASINIAEEVYRLWAFEAQAAQTQLAMKGDEVDAEDYRAQLQRSYLEKRLEDIRARNKERTKQEREERCRQSRQLAKTSEGRADGVKSRSEKRTSAPKSVDPEVTSRRESVKGSNIVDSGRREPLRASSALPRASRRSGRDIKRTNFKASEWL